MSFAKKELCNWSSLYDVPFSKVHHRFWWNPYTMPGIEPHTEMLPAMVFLLAASDSMAHCTSSHRRLRNAPANASLPTIRVLSSVVPPRTPYAVSMVSANGPCSREGALWSWILFIPQVYMWVTDLAKSAHSTMRNTPSKRTVSKVPHPCCELVNNTARWHQRL